MGWTGRAVVSMTVGLAVVLSAAPAVAAPGDRAGTYVAFTPASAALAPGFPSAAITTTDPVLSTATSATLTAATPFGAVYGSSSGRTYLSMHPLPQQQGPSVTTLAFESATPATGWSFALGDVDADIVTIGGIDAAGDPVTAAQLGFVETFNSAGQANQPTWDPSTLSVVGVGTDRDGPAAWFTPAAGLRTLSFTVTRQSGSPVVQLWIAGLTASLAGTVSVPEGGSPATAVVELADPSGGQLPGGPATAAVESGAFEFAAVFPTDVTLRATDPSHEAGALVPVSPVEGSYPSSVAVLGGALIAAAPVVPPAPSAVLPPTGGTPWPASAALWLLFAGAALLAARAAVPPRRRE